VDGTMPKLAARIVVGAMTPAQQLKLFVLKDAPLEIEANPANRDIGFVYAGQFVAIKVETFNFAHYGLLRGTVARVNLGVVAPEPGSPDACGPRSDDAKPPKDDEERQAKEPAYIALVALRKPVLRRRMDGARLSRAWRHCRDQDRAAAGD
jgi:hemolysin D